MTNTCWLPYRLLHSVFAPLQWLRQIEAVLAVIPGTLSFFCNRPKVFDIQKNGKVYISLLSLVLESHVYLKVHNDECSE